MLSLIAVDRVSFLQSCYEAYESNGMLELMLTLERSTDTSRDVSVRVMTRDLTMIDSAIGLTCLYTAHVYNYGIVT